MSGPHVSSMENPKVMGRQDWKLDCQPNPTAHGVGHPFRISLGVRLMIRRGRFDTPCRSIKNYPHHLCFVLIFVCDKFFFLEDLFVRISENCKYGFNQ